MSYLSRLPSGLAARYRRAWKRVVAGPRRGGPGMREDAVSNWGEHGVGPDPRAEAGFNGEPGFRVDPERLLLAARAAASIAQAVGELDRRLAATAVSVASAGLPGAAALIELLGD